MDEIDLTESQIALKSNEINPSEPISLTDRYISDVIQVQVLAEKKGTFLKHTEFQITSANNECSVERRYNDFVCLHRNLLKMYSNRMIPRLPPKQLMLDAFLEERRCGLQRWLFLISQHPVISKDEILKIFLSENSAEYLKLIEDATTIAVNESNIYSSGIEVPEDFDTTEVAAKSEKIRRIYNHILVLKRLIEQQLQRKISQAKDFAEMSSVLDDLTSNNSDSNLQDFSNNFIKISEESGKNYENERVATTERINLILDILVSFSDMCDRITKQFDERTNLQNNHKTSFLNREKITNLIKSSIGITEKSSLDAENIKRQNFIDVKFANEEYHFAQKYLQLLPSILLHFTFEEGKTFTEVLKIFNQIIEIESAKLN